MRAPTFEECMQAFYAECVRSWLDEHPAQPVADAA
jgi:hypothetical protein